MTKKAALAFSNILGVTVPPTKIGWDTLG